MPGTTWQSTTTDARAGAGIATILGQVMFLVAVALAFAVAATFMGRELDTGTARVCSFAGFGMLIVTWFVDAVRRGPLGIFWLCALSLLIGLGLGPVIGYIADVNPGAITTAAGITALTVLGMGALGFVLSKDLARWMRPLSFIVLGAVGVSLVALIFGGAGALSPFISLIILGASALLILVDSRGLCPLTRASRDNPYVRASTPPRTTSSGSRPGSSSAS